MQERTKLIVGLIFYIIFVVFAIVITRLDSQLRKDSGECPDDYTTFYVNRDLFNLAQSFRQFRVYKPSKGTQGGGDATLAFEIQQKFPQSVEGLMTGKNFELTSTNGDILMNMNCTGTTKCVTGFPSYTLENPTKTPIGHVTYPLTNLIPDAHAGCIGAAIAFCVVVVVGIVYAIMNKEDFRKNAIPIFVGGVLVVLVTGLGVGFGLKKHYYSMKIADTSAEYKAVIPRAYVPGFMQFELQKNGASFGVIKVRRYTVKGAISSVSDDPGSIASKKYTLCLPPESSPAEHQYCILLVAAVDQYFPDCSSTHESTCTSSSRCTWDASTKTCSSSASGTDLLLGAVVASWIIIVLSLGYGLYYLKNNYSRVKDILSGKPTPSAAAVTGDSDGGGF